MFEYRELLDKVARTGQRNLSYGEVIRETGGGMTCGGGASWHTLDTKKKEKLEAS